MRRSIGFLTILSACWVSAFVIVPNTHKPSTALFAQDSRRGFLEASTLVASGILWQGSSPAIAVGDLKEQEAQSKAEMEARLKLKAELKAKTAKPKTFQESLQKEMEKQKQDKGMTGVERRNAMCEELGRGC